MEISHQHIPCPWAIMCFRCIYRRCILSWMMSDSLFRLCFVSHFNRLSFQRCWGMAEKKKSIFHAGQRTPSFCHFSLSKVSEVSLYSHSLFQSPFKSTTLHTNETFSLRQFKEHFLTLIHKQKTMNIRKCEKWLKYSICR